MEFLKYHALGNDYLVIPRTENSRPLSVQQIQLICHRNFGLGSDGILLESIPTSEASFAIKIFNPDGSEAEISGNGLRIFARYLFDHERVKNEPFAIETITGQVICQVLCPETKIISQIGKAIEERNGILEIEDELYSFFPVSVGNPHCVIFCDNPSKAHIQKLGPKIENHPFFPNRTNVQLMKVLDRNNIQIEIWERGAGYTLASGSSACACAVIAHKQKLCNNEITVHMPGGHLDVAIEANNHITLSGPTTFVGHFKINKALFLKKTCIPKETKLALPLS